MWTKHLWLLSICSLILSCHWHDKTKTGSKQENNTGDTTHLINLVKSFEPENYKGKVPRQFYSNRGFGDFWRFPLVYPYSIGCIDVRDCGNIYSDKGKTNFEEGGSIQPLTDYFDKFMFDRSNFIGNKCKSPFDSDTTKIVDQYFIFSFINGTSKHIQGLNNLRIKLKEIKFSGDTTFLTIREYDEKL